MSKNKSKSTMTNNIDDRNRRFNALLIGVNNLLVDFRELTELEPEFVINKSLDQNRALFDVLKNDKILPLYEGIGKFQLQLELRKEAKLDPPKLWKLDMYEYILDEYINKYDQCRNAFSLSQGRGNQSPGEILKLIKSISLQDSKKHRTKGFWRKNPVLVYGTGRIYKDRLMSNDRTFYSNKKCFGELVLNSSTIMNSRAKNLFSQLVKINNKLAKGYENFIRRLEMNSGGLIQDSTGIGYYNASDDDLDAFDAYTEYCKRIQTAQKQLEEAVNNRTSLDVVSNHIKQIQLVIPGHISNVINLTHNSNSAIASGGNELLRDIGKILLVGFIVVMIVLIIREILSLARCSTNESFEPPESNYTDNAEDTSVPELFVGEAFIHNINTAE